VRLQLFNFRHAEEILESRPEWSELHDVARGIERQDVMDIQRSYEAEGKRVPAGGQTAMNRLFRERLNPDRWIREPRLFAGSENDLRKWKMDFVNGRIGVEVSFNHAEAIPWTFTRLNLAGESDRVLPEHQIDVGVAFFATESLKRWSRMDSAVGTFEIACAWLSMMKPIMPIPVLVVGLDAEGWAPTDVFRGTRQGGRS
jgi:hypothetical protein